MSDKNRKFIVFEGLDGSGKTKHINLLKKHLVARPAVYVTAEPTNSQLGGMPRTLGITQRSPARWRRFCP